MRWIICSILAVAMAGVYVWAADETKPAVDPAMAAQMEAWMKIGAPGAQHQKLQELAGKFDAEITAQMAPEAPADKSKGTETREALFGGRYLKCDYNGSFMGMPFNGMAVWGYDNQKQKYVMSWIDSMSTMIMMSEGSADEAGKTITYKTECEDPVSKQKIPGRQVLIIEDADHQTFEGYQTKDGKEAKVMTIKYTRAK